MKESVFLQKSSEFGDFYIYYLSPENSVTFAVATSNLSTAYIKNHPRLKRQEKFPLKRNEVRVWDWKSDRPIDIPLENIKKLVPLQSVLQNDRPN